MRHATILLATLAFVPLASATAQEPPPIKVGRVRLQVRYGTLVGRPASHGALEGAMREAGFYYIDLCEFSCSTGGIPVDRFEYLPESGGGGPVLTAAVSYAVRPTLEVGLFGGLAALGGTHTPLFVIDEVLQLKQSAATVAVVVAHIVPLPLSGGLRVGGGPSFNIVRVSGSGFTVGGGCQRLGDLVGNCREGRAVGGGESTTPQLGGVAEVAITWPRSGPYFLELGLQYLGILPVEVGPFEAADQLYEYQPGTTLPRRRVTFSYAVLSLGAGVRF